LTEAPKNPKQGERNDILLENRKELVEQLKERMGQSEQSFQPSYPIYEREPEEIDKPGPNGEIETIEVVVEGSDMPGGGTYVCSGNDGNLHNDPTGPRKLYIFTHFQPNKEKNVHIRHPDILCASDLRELIELANTIQSDRFINPQFEGHYTGVGCVVRPDGCEGHIYPKDLNTIPSEEFYLPTKWNDNPLYNPNDPNVPLDPKVLGDQFKKLYNDIFTVNHIMYDYDRWAQMDISMRGGGDGDYITSVADIISEGESLCALPRRNQKAGIRIKTYRRKVDLRRVTRRV
jgi:hypothetical protein